MNDIKESNNIKKTLSDLKDLLIKLSKEASEKVPGVVQQVMQIVGENIEGVGKMMKNCSSKVGDRSCHKDGCHKASHCHDKDEFCTETCKESSCSNDTKCSDDLK